jgi:hypothetical protein
VRGATPPPFSLSLTPNPKPQTPQFMDANGIKSREEMNTFLGLPQSPKKAAGAGAGAIFTSPGGESPPPAKRLKLASPLKRPRTEGGVEAKNAKRKLAVFDQASTRTPKPGTRNSKPESRHPDPDTLHPAHARGTGSTLNRTPGTLHPTPQTPNPKP